jgi:propionyl-CoA carboxylase alpha chain
MSEQKRAMTINGQLRTYQRGHGTRLVVMLDDRRYPVTIRQIEDGYKIAFENRRLYITSKWILGSKLFQCNINGQPYSLQVEKSGLRMKITYMGHTITTRVMTPAIGELTKHMKKVESLVSKGDILANMPGMVRDIKVCIGDEVVKDQAIIILEAMKMENILTAPIDGTVQSINIEVGQSVMVGDTLMSIKSKDE